ncbi:MAG: N-6 DNA methylase [bacterium]|nr:N-6 DNA methylase [bacterium]
MEQDQHISMRLFETDKELGSDSRSTFHQIRNYLAGQHRGATRDDALLHVAVQFLITKAVLTRENPDNNSLQDYLNAWPAIATEFPDLFDQEERLDLSHDDIALLQQLTSSLDLDSLDSDYFGDLYEVFMGNVVRGQNGQFFTPQNAVRLLVDLIDLDPEWVIADPACGSGSFLGTAAALAMARGLSPREAGEKVIGIDKDKYLVSLAKTRLALLTGAKSRIYHGDSLAWTGPSDNLPPISDLQVDVVLTNPPFGAKIVAATKDVQQKFELGWRWKLQKDSGQYKRTAELQTRVPPQVLFVERCLSLIKPGGLLGIVVPESLITSKSHSYVVSFLRQHAEIRSVVGMPEDLFKTSGSGGTHTKTCLLVAQRHGGHVKPSKSVFMAEARRCGNDSRGRKGVYHDDLPEIALRSSQEDSNDHLGYWLEVDEIIGNILSPRYYDPEVTEGLHSLSYSHDLVKVGDLIDQGTLVISTGNEVGKAAYGTGDIPFVRTSDISNWEIKLDPKHCVAESYYAKYANKQDVRPDDILMVRDGTYLIGTCALVTKYDAKMLFQSHILKIRVNDSSAMSPYLLLAALSSEPVQRQIQAKRFTQDIIDSLGNRLNEVILPLPKDSDQRARVTEMVRKAIDERIEARELARLACIEVVSLD